MRIRHHLLPLMAIATPALAAPDPSAWVTSADRTQLLVPASIASSADSEPATIAIDPTRRLQPITGFGFALTGGSAELLQRMSPGARASLLRELFGRGPGGIGVSWLRISIGSSDMDGHVFSYDDAPPGGTDERLDHFSLAEDQRWLVPTLREILAISPGLPILASPWSPPVWMKTNGSAKGGRLRPDMGGAFAAYLVRYVKGMADLGVPIWGITLQNEPENPKNTPSMLMTAAEQAELIANHVGPALRRAAPSTRILVFDHNADHPGYPLAIEGDPRAAPFVAGAAFHLYEGDASALATVHDAHPDKPVWLTEQMVIDDIGTGHPTPVAKPLARVALAALGNWSEGVLLWNLGADPQLGPHTNDGGCTVCEGAVTLNGDRVTRNVGYATIAQISRFVPAGSTRIGSSPGADGLPNVAFRRPDDGVVLVAANTGERSRRLHAVGAGRPADVVVPGGGAVTILWPAGGAQEADQR